MANREDRKERLDRELIEMLNELRVALPGVQVLFAFLLGVPFAGRFADLTEPQRAIYFSAFIATAVAVACLMVPTAYHRVQWRQHDKERLLRLSNRFAIAGLILTAVATSAVVYVIADILFAAWAAAGIGGALALLFAILWFVLPLARRARRD